ncbi:ferric iron uptake transcriptional regulator [Aestuariirhabdus sp. LZHN29]|uniref:ferric iron uptake transcriptional regulator n=1 Tax=Aestuariirhabdus sp. LZHN29 TaxID=3417462 RepID=UPI003CEAB430
MEEQDIKNAGLKVTAPRVKILQLLESAPNSHMSAEDVYKALIESDEDVGLATVYRVLTQFEEKGLLVRHNFNDGRSVFEIAKDDHHDHMVCVDTGQVVEFYSAEIERLQKEIALNHGYDLMDHKLVLYVKKRC